MKQQPIEQEKLWTKNYIFVCIMNLTAFISFHMTGPTFPFFILSLGGTDQHAGIAAGLFAVSSLVIRPLTGWYLDNISRKNTVFIGLIFVLIITCAYLFSTVVAIVIALRFLYGFGWGMASTSISTNATDTVPTKRFAEGIGYYGMTGSISTAIAPAIGIWIGLTYGFRPLFIIALLLLVICFTLATRFTYRDLDKNRRIEKFNLKKDLYSKSALPASLVMFFSCAPYGAVLNFVAIYAASLGISSTGMFFTGMAVMTILCRLCFARVSDRRNADIVIYVSLTSFLLSLVLLYFTAGFVVYFLAALSFGVGFGLIIPALNALAVKNALPDKRGAANSTFLISFDLGIGLGGFVAGQICGIIGYDKMFLLMIVPLFFAVIIYNKMVRDKIRLKKENAA